VESEDVVHVLRRVHSALVPSGLLLDLHPLGLDFAVRAGSRGLGFIDTRKFERVLATMNAHVDTVVREALFEEIGGFRRHVVERFDDGREALEEASTWDYLHMPLLLRARLRWTRQKPIEFLDTIRYRLLRKL
jgi:hypothetical protein